MTNVITQIDWQEVAKDVIAGHPISQEDALAMVQAPDEQLLALLQAAYTIRHHYYGNKVKLNMIINGKSGLCPEDCGYCSQSIVSEAPIEEYAWLTKDQIVAGAHEAMERQAGTYCIVASGRRPTDKEVDHVVSAVEEIRATTDLKICCCLGFLNEESAAKLAAAGVQRYNHNLNTSEENYENISLTHTYADRIDTVEQAKHAGISPCSGVIFGMGESDQEAVELAFSLQALDADSIPCNFLVAIDDTPLEGMHELNPRKCLKLLAMMRFVNPTKEIRISGGREINLRSMQAMGLYAANSLFVGDYLTTSGTVAHQDWEMIEDLGFEIEEKAI